MPAASNPLVLNNGAAVAKNFVLYAPSAGDNSVATWKLKEGTIGAVFPVVSTSARPTGNQSRKMQGKLRIPSSFTDTVTGLTKVGSAAEFDFSASVPDDFPEALKADFLAYAKNLVANAMIQAQMQDGQPAT
jgi:hypothetical protein